MPTLLGLADAPIPERVQGEDLSRQILGTGGQVPTEVLLEQTQPGNTPHYAQWRTLRTRKWLYAESGHTERPEALDRAVHGLRSVVAAQGRQAFGLFSCSKSTNEMNFIAQKFARVVMGSNNVDSCNRT